jgi:hypothetical protein
MGGGTLKSPFETWPQWSAKHRAAPVNGWASCPTCWGQRQLLVLTGTPEGDVLLPGACFGCLGVGEVPLP